jgi:ABC-2 type transport system ATP-binding protein
MNAIEIRNLCKNFGEKQAVSSLNMTVLVGAIYGFIGENGSGKSTTEKIICGLIHPSSGSVKLFDKDYKNIDIRAKMSCLIETPGCFSSYSVWNNLMLQATNLRIQNKEDEVRKVLKLVRMEGAAGNKYKNCSLGMKQRIGIAMALLGDPELLILDEPINGLDVDGMRIMREILTDLSKQGKTIVISSHILGELEKIATHYGIIRHGKMIKEMTADEFEKECRTFVGLKSKYIKLTKEVLKDKYNRVEEDEAGYIRIYDQVTPEEVVKYLYQKKILINEIKVDKVGLEEYYIDLMKDGGR